MGHRRWYDWEDELLRLRYPTISAEEIGKLLNPVRTANAVMCRAHDLGVKADNRPPITFPARRHTQRERAVRLVEFGLSLGEAARLVGASPSSVFDWCTAAGVVSRHAPLPKRPRNWRKAVIAVRDRDVSYREAGRLVGRSAPAVRRWCLEEGVKTSRKRGERGQNE